MLSRMHRQIRLRVHWTQVIKQPSIAVHSGSNVSMISHVRRIRATVVDSRLTTITTYSGTGLRLVLHLLGALEGTMIQRLIQYATCTMRHQPPTHKLPVERT
jgi:hypothetical protein